MRRINRTVAYTLAGVAFFGFMTTAFNTNVPDMWAYVFMVCALALPILIVTITEASYPEEEQGDSPLARWERGFWAPIVVFVVALISNWLWRTLSPFILVLAALYLFGADRVFADGHPFLRIGTWILMYFFGRLSVYYGMAFLAYRKNGMAGLNELKEQWASDQAAFFQSEQ